MGEVQRTLFERDFNRSIKVEASEQRITSHAGAFLLREADHRLGLVESLAEEIVDPRCPGRSRDRGVTGLAVRRATIDIDSIPVEVHGQQQGDAYTGYYRKTVYHPQVASFSVEGDDDSARGGHRLGWRSIHATLRQGQVHSRLGSRRFVRRVVENEVTMLLAMLAYNLTTMLRNECDDALGRCWDPRRPAAVGAADRRPPGQARAAVVAAQ